MLLDKLVLHLLIVLAPNLLLVSFQDKLRDECWQRTLGAVQSVTAAATIIFSFVLDDVYWNMHCIPLIIAFLYGGAFAGTMVLAASISTYLIMLDGVSTWPIVLLDAWAAAPVFFFGREFLKKKAPHRKRMTLLFAIWAVFGSYALTGIIVFLVEGEHGAAFWSRQSDAMAWFGVMFVVGLLAAGLLNDTIIERRFMRQEIMRAEKLNTLGELAASIAHEVRNPLTVVKGFLQLMMQRKQDEQGERAFSYLPLVRGELERAETIIGEYLNFAKPQLVKEESFDLRELLSQIHVIMMPLALKEGLDFTYEAEEPVMIQGDRAKLQQAMLNIVKNAVEATPSGGCVSMVMRSEETNASILVSDTGRGMTPEQLQRIGTLFYSTKEKGTGLGMTVSWQIVRHMGGDIVYRSKLNTGTEVTVTFPLRGRLEALDTGREGTA